MAIDHLQCGVISLSDETEESQLLLKEHCKLVLKDKVLFRKIHSDSVDQFQLVLLISKRCMVFAMAHENERFEWREDQ